MRKWTIALLLIAGAAAAFAQSWYQDDIWSRPDRAYQWYPDPNEQKTAQTQQQHPGKPPEVTQFEQLQKQLVEARQVAVMSPTEDNLKKYIQLQEVVLNQAATFTDQWQRVIWSNPELDYALKGRPTDATAIKAYDQQRFQDKAQAIQALAKDNGVMFFYRSDCPYCHAMAPILRQFANQYGIKVMAVSLDNGPMEGFPDALPNNGVAEKLGVTTVPAVFVMDTQSKTFTPVGFGVMSQTELENRFLSLSKPVGTVY